MAARKFAEIWGKSMHAVRHLRIVTGTLTLVIGILGIAVVRFACAPHAKPLVVRVDEVGRAEAAACEMMEARADPLDLTTGFFFTVSSSTSTPGDGARSASTGSGLSGS